MRKNVRKAIASIGVSALVVSSMLLPVSATTTTSTSTAKKNGVKVQWKLENNSNYYTNVCYMMNSKAYQKYSPNLKYDTVTVTAYLEAKSGKDNKAVKTAKNSKQLTATASLGSSNYGGSGYSKVVTTDTEYPNFSFYNKSVVF